MRPLRPSRIYSEQEARRWRGYLQRKDSPAETELFLKYARNCGGPILDLACGAGRMTMKLASAGFEIFGLDASEPMLNMGREAIKDLPQETQERIHFVQGDMRRFQLPMKFPLIINTYQSFWYVFKYDLDETKEWAEMCLECILAHLKDDGVFLIDAPGQYRAWWEEMAKKHSFDFSIENYTDNPNFSLSILVGRPIRN